MLSILTVFITGGILAHHSRPIPAVASLKSLVVSPPRRLQPNNPAPKKTWRDALDLRRAQVRKGRLEQRLSDGSRIRLTLDPGLQEWASAHLKANEVPYGAMVMVDVRSGRVLILAGHSSRDPQLDRSQICLTPWAPAASIFKLVTASALLEKGVPANAQVCYHGGLRGMDKSHITDNPRLDKTCKSLSYAVAKSINPILGKLALRYLDQQSMRQWVQRFGFNKRIPFELPVKPSRAVIPLEKLERARVAAGFWHTEISPLHGAAIASVAATGGLLRWPHLVESVLHKDGQVEVPRRREPQPILHKRAARTLGRMMVKTTTMGTARKAFFSRGGRPYLDQVAVAGKTGSLSRKAPFLHYNWFVGFAPADKPEVAFAVLLGNPAKWRIKAHTSARMLLSKYFQYRRSAKQLVASR